MRAVIAAATFFVTIGLPAAALAQSPGPARPLTNDYGPYSVYGPGLTYKQPSFSYGPYAGNQRSLPSASGSEGVETLAGGYSSLREGRNEFGTPLLGKTPYLSRGFGNVGYGRSARNTSLGVRARVIRLAEEDERILGTRP